MISVRLIAFTVECKIHVMYKHHVVQEKIVKNRDIDGSESRPVARQYVYIVRYVVRPMAKVKGKHAIYSRVLRADVLREVQLAPRQANSYAKSESRFL